MKCATGSSTLANAKEAGRQAAAVAEQGLGGTSAKVAFVYSSVAYDMGELLAGVAEGLPGVPALGNTSFTGVVTPEGFITGDEGFVGIMVVGGEEITVGTAGSAKTGTARETGARVAREAMEHAAQTEPPDYFYMAASPGEEEYYLKGIVDVIGRVPMFGGSAADNAIAGEWSLYEGEDYFGDGVVVAFVYGGSIANVFTGAYRETEDVGIITKVVGDRTLVEIDGVPAVEMYSKWTGTDAAELAGGNLLVATITSPLGVKDRLGDLIAIRHPMNGNEDGSMAVGANLCEKTAVIRMEASVDELIDSASEILINLRNSLPAPPAGYHLVHCGGRRAGIADRMNEVVEAVQREVGDTPFIMEFTFGEYGYVDDDRNSTGGLMLSYTAFME
ncbi:MAG: FIST C-terminal domain-containing protein [Coriobacteriales bacterium]|jgi:hypothetical protein|nr:FIST C-terminal domain-containing protein [Coriobacteriales bacterium]